METEMATALTPLLLRATLFTSAAIVLLLVARTALRRWFGAALAYQAWLLVPLVAIAALLPGRSAPQVLSLRVPPVVQALAVQAAPPVSPAQADVLLLAWAAGALACALLFVHAHRGFVRRAGRLTRRGDVYLSDADIGPASLGLLRPRIVVPHDFARRYTASEQALVIAHEQVHVARRDAVANLVAAIFQCLFWFNPVVHLGAGRMRQDQELACDAAVMARHPQGRRAYAEALLKSHTGFAFGAGLQCHWQSPHPTKERIMSLQQALPGTFRRLAGRCAVVLLAAGAFGATLGVRAEQAPAAGAYSVALVIDTAQDEPVRIEADAFDKRADERAIPRIVTHAGEPFAVASNGWRASVTLRRAESGDTVWLATQVFKGEKLVGAPTLLARLGERATVKVGDDGAAGGAFTLSMTVTPQP